METLYSNQSALVIDTSVRDSNLYFRIARRMENRKMDWQNAAVFTMNLQTATKFSAYLKKLYNGEQVEPLMLQYTSPRSNQTKQMTVVINNDTTVLAIKQDTDLFTFNFDEQESFEYFVYYIENLIKGWPIIKTITDEINKNKLLTNSNQLTNMPNNTNNVNGQNNANNTTTNTNADDLIKQLSNLMG